jgi:hypothetical protein
MSMADQVVEKAIAMCGDIAWEHIEDDAILWRIMLWRPAFSNKTRIRSTSWFSNEVEMREFANRQVVQGSEIISIRKYVQQPSE